MAPTDQATQAPAVNGKGPVDEAEAIVQEVEEETIPAAFLANTGLLDLDQESLDEIHAQQLNIHLREYHTAKAAYMGAKNSGAQERKAGELFGVMQYHKAAVGYIQWKYPGAKAIAARVRAIEIANVKRQRTALEAQT